MIQISDYVFKANIELENKIKEEGQTSILIDSELVSVEIDKAENVIIIIIYLI
jgi:hypothetical protein